MSEDVEEEVGPEEGMDEDLLKDNVILRSNINTTKVGEINIVEDKKEHCPTCLNVIDDKNRRLVCEKCSTTTFCSQCERTMAKTWGHKGYDLKYDWPLCRKCYREARDGQVALIDSGGTEGFTKSSDEEGPLDMGPIIETPEPEKVGRYLGIGSIILGAISVFVMGLILGPLAIGLGFMAKVRKNRMGMWGIVLGGFGIATSIFWILITGELHWFF